MDTIRPEVLQGTLDLMVLNEIEYLRMGKNRLERCRWKR